MILISPICLTLTSLLSDLDFTYMFDLDFTLTVDLNLPLLFELNMLLFDLDLDLLFDLTLLFDLDLPLLFDLDLTLLFEPDARFTFCVSCNAPDHVLFIAQHCPDHGSALLTRRAKHYDHLLHCNPLFGVSTAVQWALE